MKIKRAYGWKPDLPDHRDAVYAAPFPILRAAPPSVDLRAEMPPVYDQGQAGSCTAQAWCALFEHAQKKLGVKRGFRPSRLGFYYDERTVEGTTKQDAGAQMRTGGKVATKTGFYPEPLWPYDLAKLFRKPPARVEKVGQLNQVLLYKSVPQSLSAMRACLAEGFPFNGGISVYESFESDAVAKTGKIPMPSTSEALLGGHAVDFVGYDDAAQVFILRNSWGTGWGMRGYATIPYAYVTSPNLASSFWTLRQIEGG